MLKQIQGGVLSVAVLAIALLGSRYFKPPSSFTLEEEKDQKNQSKFDRCMDLKTMVEIHKQGYMFGVLDPDAQEKYMEMKNEFWRLDCWKLKTSRRV